MTYQADYYHKNRDRINARVLHWCDKHPERTKAHKRKASAKAYGCPPELIEAWSLACRTIPCEICGIPAAESSRFGQLHRDHSHTNPPVPRGCLCDRCNPILGALEKALEIQPFDISDIDNPFFKYLSARDPRYAK